MAGGRHDLVGDIGKSVHGSSALEMAARSREPERDLPSVQLAGERGKHTGDHGPRFVASDLERRDQSTGRSIHAEHSTIIDPTVNDRICIVQVAGAHVRSEPLQPRRLCRAGRAPPPRTCRMPSVVVWMALVATEFGAAASFRAVLADQPPHS